MSSPRKGGRHGNGISITEKEKEGGRNETGDSWVSHKGAVATHRARNLIRAPADANESPLRPVQTTRDLGNAPDVPRVVVEHFQHDVAEVATITVRPPREVRALEKGRGSCRRA